MDETESTTQPEIVEETVEPIAPPLTPYIETPPHDLIQSAQRMLEAGPSNIQHYQAQGEVQVFNPAPPISSFAAFEKFPEVVSQLRDQNVETIDLFKVRKLNLAATVETLERAVTAHEAFPSADAGIAVAKLAEQVNQLTREIEKSSNPFDLYEKVMDNAMQPLTESVIQSLAEESKWLISQFEYQLPDSKKGAFRETVKQMAIRMGPALKDALENSKARLLIALNLADKKKT